MEPFDIYSPAIAGPAPKIRLAWTEVAACHSPLGFGVAKGIYAKLNIDVELFYQGASGQTYATMGGGLRLFVCDRFDFGAAATRAITEVRLARDIYTVEFRFRY